MPELLGPWGRGHERGRKKEGMKEELHQTPAPEDEEENPAC